MQSITHYVASPQSRISNSINTGDDNKPIPDLRGGHDDPYFIRLAFMMLASRSIQIWACARAVRKHLCRRVGFMERRHA